MIRKISIALALILFLSNLSACSTGKLSDPLPPDPLAKEVDNDSDDSSADEYSRAMLDPTTAAAAAAVRWGPQLTRYAFIYYIPNRILDFVDIFRFDIGFGISYGAVGRLTKYGQFGYRGFSPSSVRFGLHGRHAPVFTERVREYGIGPNFRTNRPRSKTVTPGEIGFGADALVVGGYFGIAFDELLDFLLGVILIDYKNDDEMFR